MSLLFAPGAIGKVEIKNRLVRAPTFEGLADESGRVTDELVSVYRRLAEGDVGLILSGFMYVHRMGQVMRRQVGISSDDAVAGLSRLAEVVHASGGKIAFEMSHGGRQASAALIGRRPYGPSAVHRDPTFFIKPAAMTQQDIRETVDSFVAATRRAVAAGGDIIYIHAAGGDLLNQFLSPYFNCRTDEWGGSVDNRFRILRAIIEGARDAVGDLPILVKMNAQDYTPEPGVTPELAREYAGRFSEMGVNALELSSGVKLYCFMNCWRGEVPVKEVLAALPAWKRPIGLVKMKRWASGKYRLVEGWNLGNLRAVKPAAGRMALLLVGGMRRVEHMEAVLERGEADFICLCRPFIRHPDLVRRFKGGARQATCRSCNKCFAAAINNLPVRCYQGGIPGIS